MQKGNGHNDSGGIEGIEGNINGLHTGSNFQSNDSSIINIIPLQLLAYYWSIEKGINPDFPRNLSKILTVD